MISLDGLEIILSVAVTLGNIVVVSSLHLLRVVYFVYMYIVLESTVSPNVRSTI